MLVESVEATRWTLTRCLRSSTSDVLVESAEANHAHDFLSPIPAPSISDVLVESVEARCPPPPSSSASSTSISDVLVESVEANKVPRQAARRSAPPSAMCWWRALKFAAVAASAQHVGASIGYVLVESVEAPAADRSASPLRAGGYR